MITEDYVSFEVAKLLKEKGFDEPCTELNKLCLRDGEKPVLKVTHQKAMKWLRAEKYVIIFILPAIDDIGNFAYCYDIAEWDDNEGIYEMNHMSSWFYTYEEAVEEALKYCLENLI